MNFKEIIEPLFKSIVNIFQGQCSVEVEPKDFTALGAGVSWKAGSNEHVVSVVQLQSEDVNFSLAFCFEETTFLKFVSSMFDEKYNEITDEVRDLAAEWLNITLGHLKSVLNDKMGFRFANTIPMTIIGTNLSIKCPPDNYILNAPIKSQLGGFHVLLMQGDDPLLPWDDSFLDGLDILTSKSE